MTTESTYTDQLLDKIESELVNLELPLPIDKKKMRTLAYSFFKIFKEHYRERLFTVKDMDNAISFGQTNDDFESAEGKRKKIEFILSITPIDSDIKRKKRDGLFFNYFYEPRMRNRK